MGLARLNLWPRPAGTRPPTGEPGPARVGPGRTKPGLNMFAKSGGSGGGGGCGGGGGGGEGDSGGHVTGAGLRLEAAKGSATAVARNAAAGAPVSEATRKRLGCDSVA